MLKILYLIVLLTLTIPAYADTPTSDEALLQRVEELRALRQQNPEAFRQRIAEKRAFIKKEFGQLQKEPQEQQRFFERERNFRRERLQYFRNQRPQMFREFQSRRMAAAERFQKRPQQFQNRPQQKRGPGSRPRRQQRGGH